MKLAEHKNNYGQNERREIAEESGGKETRLQRIMNITEEERPTKAIGRRQVERKNILWEFYIQIKTILTCVKLVPLWSAAGQVPILGLLHSWLYRAGRSPKDIPSFCHIHDLPSDHICYR